MRVKLSVNFLLTLISVQALVFLLSFHGSLRFAPRTSMPKIDRQVQVQHAKELFGKMYNQSAARQAENITTSIERFILDDLTANLPKKWKKQAKPLTRAIIAQSNLMGMDPFFVLAIIKRESRYNPEARGAHGEIGLMQIKPDTAKWIAEKSDIIWQGDSVLNNPAENVRLGMTYLHYLRQRFDRHGQHYLSAYNLGPAKTRQMLNANIIPAQYAKGVMGHYIDFYQQLVISQVAALETKTAFDVAKKD